MVDRYKDLMYHYCDVETFYKIIKSKTLWLSDSSYMNDENEIIWIDNIVSEVIVQLKKELNNNQLKKLNDIQTEYERLPYKKHYFISFSKKRNILNQWKNYGDNKKGIAIGFSLRYCFDQIGLASKSQGTSKTPEGNLSISTQQLGYEPVIYGGKDDIKEVLLGFIQNEQMNVSQAALSIKELSSALKDPKYKMEEEFRITYTPENPYQDDINSSTDKILKNLSQQQSRKNENDNIPYYVLSLKDENMSVLVPEIILGSNCELAINNIKEFLVANGLSNTFVSKFPKNMEQVLE